jgi:hypothetical protein
MAEVIVQMLFERVVKPHVLGQATDEARVRDLVERALPPVMDHGALLARPSFKTALAAPAPRSR